MTQPSKARATRKATTPADEPGPSPVPDGIPDVPAHTAWAAVMRDVGEIAKDDLNKTPGASFRFRGIDATMNAVGPALRRHGVVVIPQSVELLESERYESKNKAQMHGVVTRQVWNIIGPRGDGFLMETLGQAADSGDKAIAKAASVAYRTALLQSLTIPTGDRDPDADSHERAATDPRQEQWDRIAGLAKYGNQSPAAIRAHYLEKMGHEIDGPDATVATLTGYADRLEKSFKEQAEKLAADQATPAQTPDADPAPTDDPEPAAAEPNEPPADEPAPAGTDTAPEPQTAIQGRDRRQMLWDDILVKGKANGWTPEQTRGDFRSWSMDAYHAGEHWHPPVEIDGPEATAEALTKYALAIRHRKEQS